MSSITKLDLEKLDSKQLIELCLVLADTSLPMVKALKGYSKLIDQVTDIMINDNLMELLFETNDVPEPQEEDGKKRRKPRKHKKMDAKAVREMINDLPLYMSNLKKMEELIMPAIKEDAVIVEKAREGEVTSYNKKHGTV